VGVSIVLEVARNITDKTKLTVITNSTLVINKLNSHAGITLVPAGGVLRQSELTFI
jgi:DeoR/GlpR family transcriptional regulator of sugar metabolism